MNRSLTLILSPVLILIGPFLPGSAARDKFELDSRHVNVVEMGWETPHLQFGRPSVHGPVRGLFLVPVGGGRDVVELAQRYDVDFSAVIVQRADRFGFDTNYQQYWKGISTADKTAELSSRLDENPEVLVISTFDDSKLPRNIRNRIATMVRGGMGLVLINPWSSPWSDFEEDPSGCETILSGVPLSGLADLYPRDESPATALAGKVVQAYTYGQGRAVVLRWHDRLHPHETGLTPVTSVHGIVERKFEHRCNYYFSIIGKAMDWAAHRASPITWSGLPTEGQVLQSEDWPQDGFSVGIQWRGLTPAAGTVTSAIRDASGRVQSRDSTPINLTDGVNTVPLKLDLPAAGLNYLDVSVQTDGTVAGWATASFRVERPEEIASLTMNRIHFQRGEMATGEVRFREPLPREVRLLVRAVDTYGRNYARFSRDLDPGKLQAGFSLNLSGTSSLASYVEAELRRGETVLSREETLIYTPKPKDSEFLSLMWAGTGTMRGSLSGFRLNQRIREAGFNAICHWNYEGNFHNGAIADLMPVQSVTRLIIQNPEKPGWMNLHSLQMERNYDVTDPDHSLANPVIREVLRDRIALQAGQSAPLRPWWYSIGSENNYRGEFGFSPYGLEYYRGFLERRYGTIEDFNREHGTGYAAFAEVPRQRGNGPSIPALIDSRLCMEDEWAALHGFLGDEIRKIDPEARVGAESSVIGQDTNVGIFGNIERIFGNIERMMESVDVWAPYSIYGDQLRSLAADDQMTSHWWGSYYNGPPHAGLIWDWLIQGRINFSQWWLAFGGLGTEGIFNENLTYRDYFKNLLPDLQEIHGGLGMLLAGADVISDQEVVVHYSRESYHASQSSSIPVSTDAAVRSLQQYGLNARSQDYRYTTANLVDQGKLMAPRARLLFLPGALCLSEEEARGIRKFVREGGTVVADVMPGVFNQFGRRLPEGRLDDVFGAAVSGKSAMVAIGGHTVAGTLWGRAVAFNLKQSVGDAHVRTTVGRALGLVRDIPVVIHHDYGDGRAILLNFDLGRESSVTREVFDMALDVAGVSEKYRLSGVSEPVIHDLEPGGGATLTRNNVSALRRGDVVFVGCVLPSDEVDEAPALHWDEPKHTYNVRTGEYLGRVNAVTFSPLLPTEYGDRAQVHLVSLHNEPVKGMTVEGHSSVMRGQSLMLEIRIDLGTGDPNDRLVRVDATDPEGTQHVNLRRFVTLQSAATGCTMPFAYNDPVGNWTVTVTDLATGVSAEMTVTLQ